MVCRPLPVSASVSTRFCMLLTNQVSIQDVLLFPANETEIKQQKPGRRNRINYQEHFASAGFLSGNMKKEELLNELHGGYRHIFGFNSIRHGIGVFHHVIFRVKGWTIFEKALGEWVTAFRHWSFGRTVTRPLAATRDGTGTAFMMMAWNLYLNMVLNRMDVVLFKSFNQGSKYYMGKNEGNTLIPIRCTGKTAESYFIPDTIADGWIPMIMKTTGVQWPEFIHLQTGQYTVLPLAPLNIFKVRNSFCCQYLLINKQVTGTICWRLTLK